MGTVVIPFTGEAAEVGMSVQGMDWASSLIPKAPSTESIWT